MKAMTRAWFVATLACCVLVSASSADELGQYKEKYEKVLEKTILTHGMRVSDLNNDYTKALENLAANVKRRGDLEGTKAALAEIERFKRGKNVPADQSQNPDIQKFQVAYANRRDEMEVDKGKQILTLVSQYDAALLRLQQQLTSADNLQAATAVQTERKRVAVTDVVAAAKAAMASAATATGQDVDPASHAVERAPEEPVVNIPAGYPEDTIAYEGHFYYLLPEMMVRDDAEKACKKLRGHLLSLESMEEFEFIVEQFPGKKIWLDLSDKKREGRWLNWKNDKAVFMQWGGGEPNGGTDANYAEIKGRMNDTTANTLNHVVCEWEK